MVDKVKKPDANLLILDAQFLDDVAAAGSLDNYAANRKIVARSAKNHLDRVRGRMRDYPELYTELLAEPRRADVAAVKKEKITDRYLIDLVRDVETLLTNNSGLLRDDICGQLGQKTGRATETMANHVTRARKRYQQKPDLFDPLSDVTIRYLEEGGISPIVA